MISLLKVSANKLKYWLVLIVFILLFVWWISNADLMKDVFNPAYNKGTMIKISQERDPAWKWVFHWGSDVKFDFDPETEVVTQSPSLIVKLTRYFLMFTIAISVTMILYNGLRYIVQTGSWQEWKNLVSNIIYIVIWILIAIFSVIIITLLQSAWTTIDKKISMNQNYNLMIDNVNSRLLS